MEEAKQELLADSLVEGESLSAASSSGVLGEKLLLSQHGDMIDTIEEEEDVESPDATPANSVVKKAVVIMEEEDEEEDGGRGLIGSHAKCGDAEGSPLLSMTRGAEAVPPPMSTTMTATTTIETLTSRGDSVTGTDGLGMITVEINEMERQRSHHHQEMSSTTRTSVKRDDDMMKMGFGSGANVEKQITREESLHRERHEEMQTSTTSSTVVAKDLGEIKDKNLTQILNMHTHGFTQSDDSLTNAVQQKNYTYGNQQEYMTTTTTTANHSDLSGFSSDTTHQAQSDYTEYKVPETNQGQPDLLQFSSSYPMQEEAPAAPSPPILPPKKSHAVVEQVPQYLEEAESEEQEEEEEEEEEIPAKFPAAVVIDEPQEEEPIHDDRNSGIDHQASARSSQAMDENRLTDIQIMVQEASFQATSDSEDDDNGKRLSLQSEEADREVQEPSAAFDERENQEMNDYQDQMEYESSIPQPEPEPIPEPEPVLQYEPEPEPVPQYEPEPEPVPQYEPELEPVPQYEPEPEPDYDSHEELKIQEKPDIVDDAKIDSNRDMVAETMKVISEVHEVMQKHDVQPSFGESDEEEKSNQSQSINANNWLSMQPDIQPSSHDNAENDDQPQQVSEPINLPPTDTGLEYPTQQDEMIGHVANYEATPPQSYPEDDSHQYYGGDDADADDAVPPPLPPPLVDAPGVSQYSADDYVPPENTDQQLLIDVDTEVPRLSYNSNQGVSNDMYQNDTQPYSYSPAYQQNMDDMTGEYRNPQEDVSRRGEDEQMMGAHLAQQGHSGLPTPPPDSPSLMMQEGQHDHSGPEWMASPSKISTQSDHAVHEPIYPPMSSTENEYPAALSHENGNEVEVDEFL